ncbi:MAG: DUF5069 domain-containing protein [Opitutus sp.]|nr:DUF5069 domain-containing protein [Opitutus sp.]
MLNYSALDLTQNPPRSVRVRLGGFAHLPRLLDKARAVVAGKNGPYKYDCAIDKLFFEFTGIGQEALLAEVKKGGSDTAMLEWVRANTKRLRFEILAWSSWLEQHGPGGASGHEWFAESVKAAAGERDDIRAFAELLDLDDYVSFGGKG